jgi:hypothetical protein
MFEGIFRGALGSDVTLVVPAIKKTSLGEPVSLKTLREFIAILWAKYQSLKKNADKGAVLDTMQLTEIQKVLLMEQGNSMNPFTLKEQLKKIMRHLDRY